GCMASVSISITEPDALTATASQTSSILCHLSLHAALPISLGGTPSYNGTGTFSVNAGTHSYTVTDASGCMASVSISITEPDALTSTAYQTSSILCPDGTSSVQVSALGGTPSYNGTGTFSVN